MIEKSAFFPFGRSDLFRLAVRCGMSPTERLPPATAMTVWAGPLSDF